jgi:hypothetical protein
MSSSSRSRSGTVKTTTTMMMLILIRTISFLLPALAGHPRLMSMSEKTTRLSIITICECDPSLRNFCYDGVCKKLGIIFEKRARLRM